MAGVQKKSTSKAQATKVAGRIGVHNERATTSPTKKSVPAKKLWTNRRSGNTKLPPIAIGNLKSDRPELVAAFKEFLEKHGSYAAKGDR